MFITAGGIYKLRKDNRITAEVTGLTRTGSVYYNLNLDGKCVMPGQVTSDVAFAKEFEA